MPRQQRWIDHNGLNLIRIVIGSYFMALCLGLIEGSDPRVILLPFLEPAAADLITTVLLFSVTAAFMVGLFLRLTSLVLAIFMLTSSSATNIMMPDTMQITEFWRDLTLVCAVLLCYSCLKPNEVRKAALVWRRRGTRATTQDTVVPRRISASVSAKVPCKAADQPYRGSFEPLIRRPRPGIVGNRPQLSATVPLALMLHTPDSSIPAKTRPETSDEDDEPRNIFASL